MEAGHTPTPPGIHSPSPHHLIAVFEMECCCLMRHSSSRASSSGRTGIGFHQSMQSRCPHQTRTGLWADLPIQIACKVCPAAGCTSRTAFAGTSFCPGFRMLRIVLIGPPYGFHSRICTNTAKIASIRKLSSISYRSE